MMSILGIAGSALEAQSQRLNVSASNLANADSAMGPDGQPYRAREVVFQTQPQPFQVASQQGSPDLPADPGAIGGVRVAGVVESTAPPRVRYEPGSPLADENGYVTLPNVDVVAETVNMISASRSYQANVEVINTAKTLMAQAMSIGQ